MICINIQCYYLAHFKLLVLLLLVLLSHHVDSGSIVKSLPGFEGPLPFELETGYIGLGKDENVQFFYYFFKSERNPKEDPLVIWLNGGPGCSAFNGLITVNGPVAFKGEAYNGSAPTLVSTTYSWSKIANVLYLDQPAGAGFSYAKTPFDITSDTNEVKRAHEFIQKWLSKHPNFYSNPLYITGDSYGGMIVPALVQEISKGNYICCKPLLNLQGYILGNPVTHYKMEKHFRLSYCHGMAMVSDELYESMKRVCKGIYVDVDPLNTECFKLSEKFQKCIENISTRQILSPNCDETSPDCDYYSFTLMEKWANHESVRKALHIKGSTPEWLRCNRTISYTKDIKSTVPYHKNNSIDGYPSLIFSGDHDFTLPFLATQTWIRSLNYSIVDDWRPWMVKDHVAGYTTTYANKMTFATLQGAGHTAMLRPNEAFVMFKRWISGQPL